jgi:uncharacterized protein (TIGR02186 family)
MRALFALLAILFAGSAPAAAQVEALIADLSSNEIRITTSFTGAELLLFGTVDAGAGDVVIVVRGPAREEDVRRKRRVAGVWVNGPAVTFQDVPGFYYAAATRPVAEIAKTAVLNSLQIGLDALKIDADEGSDEAMVKEYRAGLVRLKRKQALYGVNVGGITVIRDRLFRATIPFPASVPTGLYVVNVYLFRNGLPISSSETPLTVRKGGMEATIFQFAHENSALYGILAILTALVAGWLAGVIFRKA